VAAQVRFVDADCQETGLAGGSFDVAWNQESFCHVHDAAALFTHLHALLAAGGLYAITDYFRGARGDAGRVEALCAGWALPGLRSLHETASLLRASGFDVRDAREDTAPVLNSALIMRNLASRRKVLLAVEQLLRGTTDPVYEGHTDGSIACVDGLLDGAIEYGVIVARRRAAAPEG